MIRIIPNSYNRSHILVACAARVSDRKLIHFQQICTFCTTVSITKGVTVVEAQQKSYSMQTHSFAFDNYNTMELVYDSYRTTIVGRKKFTVQVGDEVLLYLVVMKSLEKFENL